MSAEDPLEGLARSILDGTDVDWDLAESQAEANGGMGRIRALRELARIVAFNRSLQREEAEPSGEDSPDRP